jgi:hypothetical protein
LKELRRSLPEASEIPESTRRDLEAVVADAEREAAHDQPNKMRLLGYIQAIGTVIQTTGSAQPAWDLLRKAAALIGFPIGG